MAEFRICPDTGFKIDLNADKLIKWNAVTAIIFLLVGGLFGLLVALTRWPGVHLLDADLFYLALTAHGLDVLLVWCIFFEIALLYFTSAILLNTRLALPKVAWISYWMMLIGTIITNIAVLRGDSSVMFTSYPPMMAAQNFYLGILIFAVEALLACLVFFATLHVARKEKTDEGSIPLLTFGARNSRMRIPRHGLMICVRC
jgi:cytochrome c oxidase subunit 1